MQSSENLKKYAELFCYRRDIYAVQKSDGSYFLLREPITLELLHRHLTGEITCGWYALGVDNTLRWVALDADREDGLSVLQRVWQKLAQFNIAAYMEKSRRGGHLWVFVEPISATTARALMKRVLSCLELDPIEIYPRQDEIPVDGVGSLLRGPLGIHKLTGERYFFFDPISLDPIGTSITDQLEYLLTVKINSSDQVKKMLDKLMEKVPTPKRKATRRIFMLGNKGNKIQQLKEAIGDLYTFVSTYVELDSKGRGSCPFHPPDRHPSFVVNQEKGYWICFHEVNSKTGRHLGGDAIEFYCRLKGLSFKEATRELARGYGLAHLNF